MAEIKVTVMQRLDGITVVQAKSKAYTVTPLRDGMFEIRSMWGDMARLSKRAHELRAAIESAVKE